MIEILFLNTPTQQIQEVSDLPLPNSNILCVKFIDTVEHDFIEIAQKFDIDTSFVAKMEDIEISSHYIDNKEQLSLNFSIPHFNDAFTLQDNSVSLILKNDFIFDFSTSKLEENFRLLSEYRYDLSTQKMADASDYLIFKLGLISDYYADLVEIVSQKIKTLFLEIKSDVSLSASTLNALSDLNFSNFLILESISEFQQIIRLLRKKFSHLQTPIQQELDDTTVVLSHIQYNFDRISDLKHNVNSKIELQQNKIFRTLTIITTCVSIPTLIAGIYGMNFNYMPELNWKYGYLLSWILIILSFIIPLFIFKSQKWLE